MDLNEIIGQLQEGDNRALARALTHVENRSEEARMLMSAIFANQHTSMIVGLTGPPGVGKSTLGDLLASTAQQKGHNVAILAIDPTSPFSGGAVLGDRARMQASTVDSSIFVRSMATRGHIGGLSNAAFEALAILESANKDFIILETVGAGQDEVEVAAAVDVTIVVLAPGLGDELQASKSGLMEIADILVVNKADRDGADILADELKAHSDGKPVLQTCGLTGKGVESLFDEAFIRRRERHLMKAWLLNVFRERVQEEISEEVWEEILGKMRARTLTPYEAAEQLLFSLKS